MPAKIIDEFSNLGLSRQRLYQLRHNKAGLCQYCNRKLFTKTKCRTHWKLERERWLLGREAQKKGRKVKLDKPRRKA